MPFTIFEHNPTRILYHDIQEDPLLRRLHKHSKSFVVSSVTILKQDSIPVGCVPPALVASIMGCTPHPQKGPGTRHTLPPMNRMTDTSEKITFPQLHWPAVKQNCYSKYHLFYKLSDTKVKFFTPRISRIFFLIV